METENIIADPTPKKTWSRPEIVIISGNEVDAKGNITSFHEIQNTPNQPYLVAGPAGSGNVPQTLYNSVAS
ncbi:hypothetical protein [Mucilaginibacter sp. UYCu711]|uniref:hypothetical protein n=1 Tax=Mucilaginibacter sp. UYCu711 TaxID=3156339 RepID=UPI003D20A6D1